MLAKQLGLKKRLHPERQGGLRPRRRDELQERARRSSASRSPASPPGTARRRRTRRSRRKIKPSGADGVFLGGLICENGGKLIKDLRAGARRERQDHRARRLHADLGRRRGRRAPTAEGMNVCVAGLPNEQLKGSRQDVRRRLQRRRSAARRRTRTRSTPRRRPRCCSTRSSSPTARARRSPRSCSRPTSTNGILGTFKIDENGDTTSNPVTIYKIKGGKSDDVQGDHAAGQPRQGGVGEAART